MSKTMFNVISPDGFPISCEPFASEKEAVKAIPAWCQRFKKQGYYSTSGRQRISLKELRDYSYATNGVKVYLTAHTQWTEENQSIDTFIDKFPKAKCPKCDDDLIPSATRGYRYQCMKCDEDFYGIEVQLKVKKQKDANDCAIDCKYEHLCIGVNCKQDNPHNC